MRDRASGRSNQTRRAGLFRRCHRSRLGVNPRAVECARIPVSPERSFTPPQTAGRLPACPKLGRGLLRSGEIGRQAASDAGSVAALLAALALLQEIRLGWTCRSEKGIVVARRPSAVHSGPAVPPGSRPRAAVRLGDLGTDPTDLRSGGNRRLQRCMCLNVGGGFGRHGGCRMTIGAPTVASSHPLGGGYRRMYPPRGGSCPPPRRPFSTQPRRRRCC